jgi:photosystem II stability/assembly factor-like uncharacterized protein
MFGHLDDRSPPEPTAATLGAVLERSARLRRRRTVSGTASIAVVALVVGIVLGSLLSRSPGPVDAGFSSQAGAAPGTAVPLSDVEVPVFVSQTTGFALAPHGTQTALVESSDGGSRWHVVNGNLPGRYPTQVEFTDSSHGYLWGGEPSSDGAAPLWVTDDGGSQWTQAPIGPVVSDVSAIRFDVWAVVGTCFLSVSAPASCPVSLEISHDFGHTWAASRSAPPIVENSALSLSDQDVELARMSHADSYILSFDPRTNASGTGQLVYTPDGGKTWVHRVDPCPAYFDFGEELAGSGTDDLWMVCASQASAGAQAKALYRSYDGGLTWALTSAANAPVLSGNVVLPAAGGLPVGGYVAPYSLGHQNLAVLSPTTAWLFPARGQVFETTDGGRTWAPVAGLARAGFGGEGAGSVTFTDATHGWVSQSGTGLWHTSDGVSWTRLSS